MITLPVFFAVHLLDNPQVNCVFFHKNDIKFCSEHDLYYLCANLQRVSQGVLVVFRAEIRPSHLIRVMPA